MEYCAKVGESPVKKYVFTKIDNESTTRINLVGK